MQDKTKIRYQNPDFRRKLQQARDYKRLLKRIPQNKLGIFLASLGLASRLAQVVLFVVILGLVYFIYAPNVFTIKHVEIAGVDNPAKADIEINVNHFFESKFYWPQNNLLLLSKNNLNKYLLSQSKPVADIIKIEKKFPSGLRMEVKQRFDKYLLKNQENNYILSNDGLISKYLNLEDLSATNTSYTNLIVIDLKEKRQFYENQKTADKNYFQDLDEIINLSENQINSEIVKFETENFEQPNISATTQAGLQIKFDVNSDLPNIFNHLRLLLKEVGGNKLREIKYIDMRIKDKGFVCYKNATCAKETSIPTATSSPL